MSLAEDRPMVRRNTSRLSVESALNPPSTRTHQRRPTKQRPPSIYEDRESEFGGGGGDGDGGHFRTNYSGSRLSTTSRLSTASRMSTTSRMSTSSQMTARLSTASSIADEHERRAAAFRPHKPARRGRWVDIQESTFFSWINLNLAERNMSVSSPSDLQDGVLLLNLVEILLGDKMLDGFHREPNVIEVTYVRLRDGKTYARPKQFYENANLLLGYLRDSGANLFGMTAADIVEGNHPYQLALIWTIILHFHLSDVGTGRQDLLDWVNSMIGPGSLSNYEIRNFTTDWNDGQLLLSLIDSIRPGLVPDVDCLPWDPLANCTRGIDLAADQLGVPPVLAPSHMCEPDLDELSVITYLGGFFLKYCRTSRASTVFHALQTQCQMMGNDGLVVEVRGGPQSEISYDRGPGNERDLNYLPVIYDGGVYEIHVTWQGKHVPGSPFLVDSAEA